MPGPETDPVPADTMRGLVGEAVGGTPIDPGTIEIAAVETGPEVRRRKKKGIGFAGWLSIVVSGAVVSIAQVKLAGVASVLAAVSLARAWKVCGPSVNPL